MTSNQDWTFESGMDPYFSLNPRIDSSKLNSTPHGYTTFASSPCRKHEVLHKAYCIKFQVAQHADTHTFITIITVIHYIYSARDQIRVLVTLSGREKKIISSTPTSSDKASLAIYKGTALTQKRRRFGSYPAFTFGILQRK